MIRLPPEGRTAHPEIHRRSAHRGFRPDLRDGDSRFAIRAIAVDLFLEPVNRGIRRRSAAAASSNRIQRFGLDPRLRYAKATSVPAHDADGGLFQSAFPGPSRRYSL